MTVFVVDVKAISFAFMKLESWQVTKNHLRETNHVKELY